MKFIYGDRVKINWSDPFYDNSKFEFIKRGTITAYDYVTNKKIMYEVQIDNWRSKYFFEEELEHENR